MTVVAVVDGPRVLCVLGILFTVLTAGSSGHPATASQAPDAQGSRVLAAAADKGAALLSALRQYSYYSELTIESISQADTVTGKYYRFVEVSFDAQGQPRERVIENTSTLPEDLHLGTSTATNLARVYSFLLTPETLNQYEFTYFGREQVDELNTYVFDVQPRGKLPDPGKSSERFLRGRIWIDDQDLCVVKVDGQAVPNPSRRRPKFETYYQNYEHFWFPASAKADDIVRSGRYAIRVVVKVQFSNYRRTRKQG